VARVSGLLSLGEWVVDGVSGLDVLTVVLRVAPAVVPLAVAWLALIVWFRLLGFGRLLRARGQERLGLYLDFVVVSFGVVGAFFLITWVDWTLGGDEPLSYVLADLRLTAPIGFGSLIGVSALLRLAYFAVAVVSGWVSAFFREAESPYALALRPQTAVERFAWVTAMSPTAGFCEEVIFRGIALSVAFILGADVVIAVTMTSLLFALRHAVYGLTWTVGTMVLGVASAVAVLWSGSLWPAIIAHTLYDMTVYYVFETPVEPKAGDPVPEPARFIRFLRSLPPMR
jgi:membrane protease YdiL (CAAX protease family)